MELQYLSSLQASSYHHTAYGQDVYSLNAAPAHYGEFFKAIKTSPSKCDGTKNSPSELQSSRRLQDNGDLFTTPAIVYQYDMPLTEFNIIIYILFRTQNRSHCWSGLAPHTSSRANTSSMTENDAESKVRGLASEIQLNIKGADLGEDDAVGSRIYSSSSTPAIHGAQFLKNGPNGFHALEDGTVVVNDKSVALKRAARILQSHICDHRLHKDEEDSQDLD
ncbi:uncharacterized protein FSUBG_6275 [Fusarium subglutinans]|uniref:Uncharacterized protein n=1 Tax=Gibberella subglutinans TaxID=42677 RepID=A0A8H5Q0E2_GIBSU|nr:uncharacterized protein FSUBG_6275 [Fusarium subglutinans]KAF5605939.1 hypothetical protein FSUBG_6275 [Fusarium subglutinans]